MDDSQAYVPPFKLFAGSQERAAAAAQSPTARFVAPSGLDASPAAAVPQYASTPSNPFVPDFALAESPTARRILSPRPAGGQVTVQPSAQSFAGDVADAAFSPDIAFQPAPVFPAPPMMPPPLPEPAQAPAQPAAGAAAAEGGDAFATGDNIPRPQFVRGGDGRMLALRRRYEVDEVLFDPTVEMAVDARSVDRRPRMRQVSLIGGGRNGAVS